MLVIRPKVHYNMKKTSSVRLTGGIIQLVQFPKQ